MKNEIIHEEWGTVYLNSHRSKAHLYPDCQYLSSKNGENMDKYPVGHLEFCSACVERMQKWREGLTADEHECRWCGKKGVSSEYCEDCYPEIRRIKAQSQL